MCGFLLRVERSGEPAAAGAVANSPTIKKKDLVTQVLFLNGGGYWGRTSDFYRVKVALSR